MIKFNPEQDADGWLPRNGRMRISSRAPRSASARKAVTAEEIIEFASEFDAQPMHLDEAAGKASILGGLSASGWHTCAMFMRLICDGFLLDSTSQGSPGIDHAKWKKPVLAGDTLSGSVTVIAASDIEIAAAARASSRSAASSSTSTAKRCSSCRTPACS